MSVSLLVRHPDADLSGLSDALALPAFRTWNKGDPVITPKGRRVGGTYSDSRWSHVWPRRRGSDMAAAISGVLDEMEPRRAFLRQLRRRGAVPQVILSVAGLAHVGGTLAPELLARLADLGLELGIEFFAEPQGG
jgi:hypothetical protein